MSTLAPFYHDKAVLQTTLTGSALKRLHVLCRVRGQLDSFTDPIWTPWSTAAPVSVFADGVWAALLIRGQLALAGL